MSTDELLEAARQWGATQHPLNPIVRMRLEFADGDTTVLRMPTLLPQPAVKRESVAAPDLHRVEEAIIEVLSKQQRRMKLSDLAKAVMDRLDIAISTFYLYRKSIVEKGLVDITDDGYSLVGSGL